MKITIITAVYNGKHRIADAIESVIQQDYPDIEYIVVEGCSTDGTLNVINRYREKIAKIVSEPDKGLYDALNKGIELSTGDYIGFVHADDMLYDTHVISRVVEKINSTNCDIFYGDGIYLDNNDKNKVVRNWVSGKYNKSKIAKGWLPLHPTMYIKREVYMKNGLYDISYKISGDTELLLRYLYNNNLSVAYLHKYIIKMRMGGLSTSVWQTKNKWSEDVRAYHKNGLSAFCLVGKILRKVPQFVTQKSFYSFFMLKLKRFVYK